MRRTRVSRALAMLFALWFAVLANQPRVYGACPMSPAHAGSHAGAHGDGGMAMSMPMDGAEHDMAPRDGSSPSHAPAQLPADCCSCIAACCGSAALPTANVAGVVSFAFLAPLPVRGTGTVRASRAIDLVLPFANGPPAYLAV